MTVFGKLIEWVTFDILESGALEEMGIVFEYDVSDTEPFNDGFDILGYGSSEPIDLLGTINFLLAYVIIVMISFFIRALLPAKLDNKLCCGRKRRSAQDFTRGIISFMLPIAFEIFICIGAVFYIRDQATLYSIEEPTSLDTFCIWYTASLGFIFVIFGILVAVVSIYCVRKKVELSKELRLA